VQGDAVDQ